MAKDFLSGGNFYVFLFFVLVGSILPDIDEENSKIVQWSGIMGKIVSFFSRHRGFFHSLVFGGLACLLVKFFWSSYYGLGLFLGMMGHLLLDSLTKKGVSFLYPFSGWRVKGWLRTGGWGEILVQIGLVGLVGWKVMGV